MSLFSVFPRFGLRRLLPLALFCSAPLLSGSVVAQPLSSVLPQFDRDVERIFGTYHVPGAAVAVVQNGKVVYVKTLGVGSTTVRNPVDEHTVFRLASVSKTFAAVLAGQAAYAGELNFNAPLSRYLPGFRLKYDTGNKLTVRNVLSHTSGLPHNANDNLLEAGESYPTLLNKTERLGAACPIGRCFGYQNIIYSTIGDVLSRQLGHSYPDLLRNRIFGPLGMQDASATRAAMLQNHNIAVPHAKGGSGWAAMPITQPYYNVTPAAGVNASITDMGKYLAAVMGHRPDVIPTAVMQELTKPLIRSPKEGSTSKWRQTRIKNPMYGMGWRIFQYNGNHKMIFHAGGLRGVRARLGFLPEKDIGLVMLWNANVSYPEVLMPMLFDRLLDLPEVDYLDGAASQSDFYASQEKEGVTRVAASLLSEHSALKAAKSHAAHPASASAPTPAPLPASDGITSLTAQRLGRSASVHHAPTQGVTKSVKRSSGHTSSTHHKVTSSTKSKSKATASKKRVSQVKAKPKAKAKPTKTSKSGKAKSPSKVKAPTKRKATKTSQAKKKTHQ